jgi:hypothetical protein
MKCKRRFMHGKRLRRSPLNNKTKDIGKVVVKAAKPLIRGLAGKALGGVGLFLGATKTATADTTNVVKDGVVTNKYTGQSYKSLF